MTDETDTRDKMAEVYAKRDEIRANIDARGDLNNAGSFAVKDSGKREEFESGMVRDTTEGKTNFTLVLDGPMFERWAEHMTKGAEKYDVRNWMKASGDAELERFKESALRHFLQWFNGETDEDHAAAVFFNINGAEYVKKGIRLDAIKSVMKGEITNG